MLFWRFNNGTNPPAEITLDVNDDCLITARIYAFRDASTRTPPFEAKEVAKYYWNTAEEPLFTDIPSAGPATGDGRLAVGFVVTAHGRHCDFIANHTELDDSSTFLSNPYRRTNHSAYIQTEPPYVNNSESSRNTRIIRNHDLQYTPCMAVKLLLIPESDVTPSYGNLYTEANIAANMIIVAPASAAEAYMDYECGLDLTISGTMEIYAFSTVSASSTSVAHPVTGTLYADSYINAQCSVIRADVTTTASALVTVSVSVTASGKVYEMFGTLFVDPYLSSYFVIETTALSTVDDEDPAGGGDDDDVTPTGEVHLFARLTGGMSFDSLDGLSTYTNSRVALKEQFLPGKTLSHDQFVNLIDFISPDIRNTLTYLSDKSGLLEAVATVSGAPMLGAVAISTLTQDMLYVDTTSELAEMVAGFDDKSLVKVDDVQLYFGVGMSANYTKMGADYNPIKLGLQTVTKFTSASATNVLINQFGRAYYAFCTSQKSNLFSVDTYGSLEDDYTYEISGETFDLYYSNITTTTAGRVYIRLNTNTDYSFVGVSANGSTAGLILAERSDNKAYPKSGVVKGYHMGGNYWVLTNIGGNQSGIHTALAYVTCTSDVSSISIVAQNGEIASGCVRVISHNLGVKS
jgi:hypothetical protein